MSKTLQYRFAGLIVIACMLIFHATAQDIHFSQSAYAPLQMNPALTGIFDGKARISNIYRSQWSGLGNGYKTIYLSADAPVGKAKLKNNYFGVGGLIYQDKAGEAGFKSTILEASLSYTTAFDDQADNFISIGFQTGLNSQSFDINKATWDSQWNGDAFDPSLPSYESIQLEQVSYLDFNAGLLYYYIPNESNSFNFGGSISHIGGPNVSHYSRVDAPMEERITLHTSAEINFGKDYNSWFDPRITYMMQGPQKELVLGGLVKNKIKLKSRYTNYNKEAFFSGGLFYRWKDAIIANVRFEYNTLGLGISYDINNSSLSNLAGSANAFEVNLTFVSFIKRGQRTKNYNKMPKFF